MAKNYTDQKSADELKVSAEQSNADEKGTAEQKTVGETKGLAESKRAAEWRLLGGEFASLEDIPDEYVASRGDYISDAEDEELRLFAHLHLDPRLSGSHLEGSQFSLTTRYILDSLKQFALENSELAAKADIKTSIEKMELLFKDLVENETLIEQVANQFQTTPPNVSHDLKTTAERVAQLQKFYIRPLADNHITKPLWQGQGKNIIFPMGWRPVPEFGTKGHAMVGQIIQTQDGSYDLIIYNTGAGLPKYHKLKSLVKDKYQPIIAYKLTVNAIIEIEKIVTELITPLITPSLEVMRSDTVIDNSWPMQRIFDANRVYKLIEDTMQKTVGIAKKYENPLDALPKLGPVKLLTQGQLSGTCAMYVIIVLLKANMEKEAFQVFDHQLKLKSISKLFNFQKDKYGLKNKMANRMLLHAIRRRQLKIDKLLERGSLRNFTKEQLNQQFDELEKLKEQLKGKEQDKAKLKKVLQKSKLKFSMQTANRLNSLKKQIYVTFKSHSENFFPEKEAPIILENTIRITNASGYDYVYLKTEPDATKLVEGHIYLWVEQDKPFWIMKGFPKTEFTLAAFRFKESQYAAQSSFDEVLKNIKQPEYSEYQYSEYRTNEYFEHYFKMLDKHNKYKLTFKEKDSNIVKSIIIDERPKTKKLLDMINKVRKVEKGYDVALNTSYIQDPEHPERSRNVNVHKQMLVHQIYKLVKMSNGEIAHTGKSTHTVFDDSETKLDQEAIAPQEVIAPQEMKTLKDFTNPLDLFKSCYQTCYFNDINGNSETVMHQIEELFLSISLDAKSLAAFFATLKPEASKEALGYLHYIIRIYGKNCRNLNPYPSAIQGITSITGFVLANYLMKQYYNNDEDFNIAIALAMPDPSAILNDTKVSPVSMDPRFDERLEELRSILNTIKATIKNKGNEISISSLDYYDITLIKKRFPNSSVIDIRKKIYKREGEQDLKLIKEYDSYLRFIELRGECLRIEKSDFKLFEKIDTVYRSDSAFDVMPRFWSLQTKSNPFGVAHIVQYKNEKLVFAEEYITTLSYVPLHASELNKQQRHQYALNVKDKFIEDLIYAKETLTSNELLLKAQKAFKQNQSVYHARSLPFASRYDKLTPIKVKDYFESNLEDLNKEDYLKWFLLSFFAPNNLLQLFKNETIGKDLHNFVQIALKHHLRTKNLTEGGLFIFEFCYFLKKYCRNMPGMEWLPTIEKLLVEKIDSQAKIFNIENTNKLLQIQFLNKTLDTQPLNKDELQTLLRTTLIVREPDYLFDLEFMRAQQKMKPRLEAAFNILTENEKLKLLQEVLPDSLKALKIEKINFPYCILQGNYKIDLSLGKIESLVGILSYLPKEIKHNDTFIRLFGTSITEALKKVEHGNTIYEFLDQDKRPFKIIRKNNGEMHFQTIPLNEKNWFELIDSKKIDTMNNRYKDGDCTWWREVRPAMPDLPNDYCILRNTTKKEVKNKVEANTIVEKAPLNEYLLKVQRKQVFQTVNELIPATGLDTGYILLPSNEADNFPLYNIFSQFESIENISIFASVSPDKKPAFRVTLPRYNLEFQGNYNQNNELEFVWTQNPRFKLDFNDTNLLDDFPHILYMLNETTNEKIALVPRQEFYLENIEDKDGEYYRLNYDINNTISNAVSDRNQVNISDVTSTNSQKYDVYKLKKTKQNVEFLEATNTEGYLQLAYIYLGKHDPENAISALRKCFELGIKGTETEINLVKNIIEGAPSKKHNDANFTLARTNDPVTVSARLLAACILTQQKQKSFNNFTLDDTLSRATQNRDLLRSEIEVFYKNGFDNEVRDLYVTYRKVQGLVPEEFQLSYDQRQLLLESSLSLTSFLPSFAETNELFTLELLQTKKQRALIVKNNKKTQMGNKKVNAADLKLLEATNESIRNLNAQLDHLRNPKLKEDVISLFGKDSLAQFDSEQEILDMSTILPELQNKQLNFEDTQKGTDNIPNFAVFKQEISKLQDSFKEFRAKTVKGFNYKTFEERAKERIHLEKVLGRAEKQTTAGKNKIYMEFLTSSKRAEMKAYFGKLALSFNKDKTMDEIVNFANSAIKGTKDEKLGLKKLLTFEDLLWLYLQGDRNLLARQTRLADPRNVDALCQQIHQFLLQATEQQQCQRILKNIENMENISDQALSDPTNIEVLSDLGNEVSAKREYDPRLHPEILIFEFLENKLARKNQVDIVERMMQKTDEGYENNIYQLIMNFGKSKFLNVVMALKRADGTNLSIIEFPQSLFHASFADLSAKTFKLFGKRGFPLLFDRKTDCNSQNLLWLYQGLKTTIRNRDFVATTPESLKSLLLKYLELTEKDEEILFRGLSDEESHQIIYLENILKLIRQGGDVFIDEIDFALAHNKELNYPILSEAKPVPPFVSSGTLKIFDCFEKVSIRVQDDIFTLKDVMLGKKSITTDKMWQEALSILANRLFDEKPSYFSFVKETDNGYKEYRELITQYILRTIKDRPDYFKTLPQREQELIDLAKGDLELLKSCLQMKPGVHYGFPLKENFKGSKELAIPFFSSGEPNYRAKKSLYETMILTIILQNRKVAFEGGLTKALVERFIKDFKFAGLNEMTNSEDITFEETIAFRKFAKLTGGLSLNDIERDVNKVEKLSAIPKVFNFVLRKYILSENTEYNRILKATNVNHISQFRSASGFSGTPAWNGYHVKMNLNEEDNVGIDGTTMSLIEDKNPDVTFLKNKDPSYILDATLLEDPEIDKIRAFIDIGALFEGRSNIEIARLIVQKLNSRQGNKIKFVLFFNEDKQLCALPLDGRDIIVIGSTDPEIIKTKTNSELKDLFAYYSQTETTAIDIKLEKDTKGVVTIDLGTRTRDCLQGVMRLRSLHAAQSFKFALPERLKTLKPGKVNWNWEDVLDLLEQYNNKAEIELKTAIENMKNAVMDFCLYNKMMGAETVVEKIKLRSQFKSVFETIVAINPSEKFRQTEIRLKTTDILQKHLKLSLEKLKQVNKNLTPFEEDQMLIKLTIIKNKSLRKCAEFGAELLEMDTEIELEKEMEKEKEKEKEMEYEKEPEIWDKVISAKIYLSWKNRFPIPLKPGTYPPTEFDNTPIKIDALTSMIGFNLGVSKNILVTENYLKTYFEQQDSMDTLIKPLDFFFAVKEKDNTLKILCITQEEAIEFMDYLNSESGLKHLNEQACSAWIISNHNVLLCGTSKTIPNSEEYRSLLAQLQYFNGDLDLLSRDNNFDWLLEGNTLAKLEVLKKRILPNYPEKARYFDLFRKNLQTALLQRFKVDLDFTEIFKAIRNENEALGLKNLTEYLENLRKIPDNLRMFAFTLTTIKENNQYLSPLTLAIKLGKPEFVKLLLKSIEHFSFTNIQESPILIALQNKKFDILNDCLLLDTRFYPEASNIKDWQILFDHILNTNNQEIILKFLEMMKKHSDQTVIESITSKVLNKICKGLISGDNIFKMLHNLSRFTEKPITLYETVIQKALKTAEPPIVVNILNSIRSNLKQLETNTLKQYFSDQLYFEIERPELLEYMLQKGFLKFPENVVALDKILVHYLEHKVLSEPDKKTKRDSARTEPHGNLNIMLNYIFNLDDKKKSEILSLLYNSEFTEIFIDHVLNSNLKLSNNKNYKLYLKNLPITSPVWVLICKKMNRNSTIRDELEFCLIEVLNQNKKTLKEDQFLLSIVQFLHIQPPMLHVLIDFDFKQPFLKKFAVELFLYLANSSRNINDSNFFYLEMMFKNGLSLADFTPDKFNILMQQACARRCASLKTLDFIMMQSMQYPKFSKLFLDAIVSNKSWHDVDSHFKLLSDSLDKLTHEQKIYILNSIHFSNINDPKSFEFAFKIVAKDTILFEALKKILDEKQVRGELLMVQGTLKFIESPFEPYVPNRVMVQNAEKSPRAFTGFFPKFDRTMEDSMPNLSSNDLWSNENSLYYDELDLIASKYPNTDKDETSSYSHQSDNPGSSMREALKYDILDVVDDISGSTGESYWEVDEPKERSPKHGGKSPRGRKSKYRL